MIIDYHDEQHRVVGVVVLGTARDGEPVNSSMCRERELHPPQIIRPR
jgi:hypothetical protein